MTIRYQFLTLGRRKKIFNFLPPNIKEVPFITENFKHL